MTVPVSYLQLAAAYRTDRRVGVFVYCPAFARTSEYASCLFFSPYHCVSLSLCLFLPVPFPCHLTVFCPQAGERGVLYGSVRVLLRTRDWARHSASSVSPGPPRRHHVMSASHILPLAFSPFFFWSTRGNRSLSHSFLSCVLSFYSSFGIWASGSLFFSCLLR